MQRVVVDTNIYIDWLNEGRHEDIIFRRDAVKHLSAVVLMELLAGAFSVEDRRLVRNITLPFAKAHRIVTPTVSIYQEAGDVLRRLQRVRGYTIRSAYGLVNDVLIALSARSIGASVITQNERDFAAIQSVRPFKLVVA
ncbi:MAG: type II toxin-antitoxin system VapC family toxin [Deltaproteobacteria bacterium]|nr:type II toxin-antitoxin system VapC family toxin [Deltaproteobacteria bacterium]